MKNVRNSRYFSFVKRAIGRALRYLPLSTYNKRFYDTLIEKYYCIAEDFVQVLCEIFHPTSVVDMGCGVGIYLKLFEKKGIEVRGYEGSRYAVKNPLVSRGIVKHHDLRRPLDCKREYSLCLCMEVAEHLCEKHARSLVETLTRLSDTVYFTAAKPGQGGDNHVNEEPPEYWENLFNQCGFALYHALTGSTKKMLREANPLFTRGDIFVYENCMIFTRMV